jgi:molybdate transport system substrate-binding protein
LLALAIATSTAVPSGAAEKELTVFAAVSLAEALTEVGTSFAADTGIEVAFHFGASSTLARQIDEGAPADLFVSADEAKVDALAEKGVVDPATRRVLLSNRLVIVIAAKSGAAVTAAADLASPSVRILALAEPQSVPAGIYAKAYLQNVGLWERVVDKVVPTENVRAALYAVESGNADAAIVYATDAAISKQVRVAVEVPDEETPAILYVAAVPTGARDGALARRLLDFLGGERALELFRRAGFRPPPAP